MRDVLLLLLCVHAVQVSPQPYQADSEGKCGDAVKDYKLPGSNLCCRRCRPGRSLSLQCSEATDSVCVDCGAGRYMETWNYYKNCFTCTKCKETRGLQYAEHCSPVSDAKCVCQPGRYCTLGYDEPYCKECVKYKTCKVGYGVSKPGSAQSDVRCEPCLHGTFSDTKSSTDPCRPHTNCSGSVVIRQGDATSDTACERQTTTTASDTAHTTASTTSSAVEASSTSVALLGPSGDTRSGGPLVSTERLSPSSERPPPPTAEPAVQLVGAIAGIFGGIFLLIVLTLLCFCQRIRRRDSARLRPKAAADRNGQSDDEISPIYLECQLTTFTAASPEQQCLLEKGPLPCGERSPSRNSSETSSGSDGHGSHESVDPSQSTLECERPHSAPSEPTPSQPAVPAPPPSQPTGPHTTGPVAPGPHVNVNITLNIGNGSSGAASCLLTGLKPADCDLPFGEEEECVCTPQQEGGKESSTSVEESDGDCT